MTTTARAIARYLAVTMVIGALGIAPALGTTVTPSVTATPRSCVGDCNGDGMVRINEIITGLHIALGNAPLSVCPAFDCPQLLAGNFISCGVTAVNNALNGCPVAPTATPAPPQLLLSVEAVPLVDEHRVSLVARLSHVGGATVSYRVGCTARCRPQTYQPISFEVIGPDGNEVVIDYPCGGALLCPEGLAELRPGEEVEQTLSITGTAWEQHDTDPPNECRGCNEVALAAGRYTAEARFVFGIGSDGSDPFERVVAQRVEFEWPPSGTSSATPTITPIVTPDPASPTAGTSGPTSTPTPSCAPTGTAYCSNDCRPCRTIRAGCYAHACGACRQNPLSCPTGEIRACAFGASGCCVCGTPTPTPSPTATGPTPTTTPSATGTATGTPAVGVFVYVADHDLAALHVINAATNSETISIPLPSWALDVAISRDGRRAYVVGAQTDGILVIDTVFNVLIGTIAPHESGWSIAVSPSGPMAYVAVCDRGELIAINTDSGIVAARIPISGSRCDVAVSSDGAVAYVTNSEPPSVSVVDLTNNTVIRTIAVPSIPLAVGVAPNGKRIFVGEQPNFLSIIDTATETETARVTVGGLPLALAVTPDGAAVYVANRDANSVSVVDTAAPAVVRTITVGEYPVGVAITPDGAFAYVGNAGYFGIGTVSAISTQTLSVISSIAYPGTGAAPFGVAVADLRP